jgi:hypothetical protein
MSEIKHTRGPWLRQGTLIYSLQHHGWRKGEETFCNRFSAGFSLGPGCTEEELIASATLAQAAPELLEALRLCYDHCRLYTREVERNNVGEAVRAAIAKATGSQS